MGVLLIENEVPIARGLLRALRGASFAAGHAPDGEVA